jgi:hypothetical protein
VPAFIIALAITTSLRITAIKASRFGLSRPRGEGLEAFGLGGRSGRRHTLCDDL